MGWWRDLASDLFQTTEADLIRIGINAGGLDNMSEQEKYNFAKCLGYTMTTYDDGSVEFEADKSSAVVDGILGLFFGEGND